MAGQQYLPLPGWINARINDVISRGAEVRIWLADPLENVRVDYSISNTFYASRLVIDPGIPVSGAPIPVDDLNRTYWLLVKPPGWPWYKTQGGHVREDGQIQPQGPPLPLTFPLRGFGFTFDPNEPAKEWAGFARSPDGAIIARAPEKKSHSNEHLAIGVGLFAAAVVAGEYFAGAAANSGAGAANSGAGAANSGAGGAELMGPPAPPAETVVPPVSPTPTGNGSWAADVGKGLKTAADTVNTAAATAANVVGAAAAVKGAWTDPKPATPTTSKPPPDQTDWTLYAAAAVVGVLLLTQGAKA